jgi:hypothetical protein
MASGDYELAARVWQSLKDQGYWTPSTAAARLAFPLSLEHVASGQAALAQFRIAEQSFEARLASLDTLSASADDTAWVTGMLRVFTSEHPEREEASAKFDEWRAKLGHTDWLEWLATEDVHELMLEWRELDETAKWLDRMPDELAILDELSQEQRRRAAEARELITSRGLLERREALATTIEAMDERIADVSRAKPTPSAEWFAPLAQPDEAKLLAKIARMRAVLERASAAGKGDRAKGIAERLARIEGLVFWQIADDEPARLRKLVKANRANRALLADIDSRIARVQSAEHGLATGVQTDFLAFQTRADAIAEAVHKARDLRQGMLAAQLREGIRRERGQVEKYLLLTRIAIARAMDQIAMKSDGDEAIAVTPGAGR